VTREGVVIPSSRIYTPYVLIASGNFDLKKDTVSYQLCDTLDSDRNIINALHWVETIEKNNFIKNCVGQLYCNNRNQFELTVRGLDTRVIVGDTLYAADKLKRLEIFMKQRIDNPETQTLKSINLNYKNQIVCTKR
jgi:cell division protein FtsQ